MTAVLTVEVSVLVPVLDEAASIDATVRAMLAQDLDGSFELLFADGGSQDGTVARLEALARDDERVRVFANPRRGTASGLNVCLREARGTHVARMDAHTWYPKDYLRLGIERLAAGDVAWVAGPQLPRGRGPVSRAVAASVRTPLGAGGSRKWQAADAEYDLDTGVFCGVWRRADVMALGGFDEGWPRNQDSELAARFLRAGERIVCVGAMAADYQPRDTVRCLWRQYREYGVYRARTALRHPSSLRRSAVLPVCLVLTAAAAVLTPRPLRIAPRGAVGLYGAALAAAAARARREQDAVTAATVPIVLVVMHAAHGVGFLQGTRRWGVPWRALGRVLGVRRAAEDVARYDGPVSHPSLVTA